MNPEDVESLLAKTHGPLPPERLEGRILDQTRPPSRFLGRLSMAASLLICAGVFWILFPKPQDAATLVEKLRSDVFAEREEATRKLKELGNVARPDLEKAARDKDLEVSQRAKAVLRILDTRAKLTANLIRSVPGIEERLSGLDGHAWTDVLLGAIETRGLAGPDLDALAGDALRGASGGQERKDVATRYLERRIELEGSRDRMLEILKTFNAADADDRRLLAWAIGAFGIKEGIPDVLKLTHDDDPKVRAAAVCAAGKLGAREAVPRLLEILRDRKSKGSTTSDVNFWAENSVKIATIYALADIGATEAVPELVTLLKEEWSTIEKGFTQMPLNLHTPRDIAGALGKLGGEREALDVFASPARTSIEQVRHQAIWCMSHLQTVGASRELVAILADPKPAIRVSALGALGQHPMKEAAGDVVKLLNDPSPEVRAAAVWCLRDLGAREAAGEIAKRLDDSSREVRIRVASVICEFGLRDGVPTVLKEFPEEQNGTSRWVDLDILNGVRRQELMRRLSETPFKGRVAGRPPELLRRIEQQTGLTIEATPEERGRLEQLGGTDYGWTGLQMSIREVLRIAMQSGGSFILEKDRIRLLSRSDAAAFWGAWWAESQKSDK